MMLRLMMWMLVCVGVVWSPELASVRALYLKIIIRCSILIILVMWAFLPLYVLPLSPSLIFSLRRSPIPSPPPLQSVLRPTNANETEKDTGAP